MLKLATLKVREVVRRIDFGGLAAPVASITEASLP
jgi:hypothetical protein